MSACERERLRKAVSCGRQRTAFFSRRNGADDEGAGSDIESGCGEAEVVGSSRDYGRNGPYDAGLAGAAERARLWRLWDYRKQSPSPKRVPMQTVEQVLQLYREKYFDLNVQHFHEKLQETHGIELSYTLVKTALQTAGLVKRRKKPASHRKRRHAPRTPWNDAAH
jgi:hypothetical protein